MATIEICNQEWTPEGILDALRRDAGVAPGQSSSDEALFRKAYRDNAYTPAAGQGRDVAADFRAFKNGGLCPEYVRLAVGHIMAAGK